MTTGLIGNKRGHDLGYTRYDKTLGCYAKYVEEPAGIRPALQRLQKGRGGHGWLCQLKTAYRARATTVRFSSRET